MSSSGTITGAVFQLFGIGASTPSTSSSTAEAALQLLDVSDGTVLRGTANGRSPQGATVIATPSGEVLIQTNIFLKRGIEVAIQVERHQNETLGRLISIDGKSVPKYLELQSAQIPSNHDVVHTSALGGASNANATASSAVIAPDQVIPARVEVVVLTKAVPAPNQLPATQPLPAVNEAAPLLPVSLHSALSQVTTGSRLVLDVLGVTFPDNQLTPSTAPTPNQSPPAPASPVATPATGAATTVPPEAAQPAAATGAPLAPVATPPSPATALAVNAPVPTATASAAPLSSATAFPAQGLAAYQRVAQVGAPNDSFNPSPSIATVPAATVPASPVVAIPPTAASPVLPPPPNSGEAAETNYAPITPQAPSASTIVADALSTLRANPSPAVNHPAPATATAPPPSPPPSPSPAIFSATIIGTSGPQELILQTPIGTLKLLNTTALPQGTQLQVRLSEILPVSDGEGAAEFRALGHTLQSDRPWQAFDAYASLLANAARPAGTGNVPAPGKEALSDILFLFAALKGGDVRRWLGENRHRELETGHSDLLSRLGAEFTALRAAGPEIRDPNGWNLLTLPFLGSALEPVRMFYKRQQKKEETSEQGESDYFLIDMMFPAFGHMQLDGMVKKQDALQFDLIIRTEKPLENGMEHDIRAIYQEASDISGYHGSIAFRHGIKACVVPPINTSGSTGIDHSIVV